MRRFSEMTSIVLLAMLVFVLHLSVFVARSEKLEIPDEVAARARPVVPRPEQKRFRGEVVNVDASGETLVAKRKKDGVETSFDLTFAKFLRGTKVEQLKAGDGVALKYVVNDGKNFVTFIVAIPQTSVRSREDNEAEPIGGVQFRPDRM